MIYSGDRISLPAWISARTYLAGSENSRTYIINERDHTHIQLDGISSDFWDVLTRGDESALKAFADAHSLADDADIFLEELASQGLIILSGFQHSAPRPAGKTDGEFEESKFVEERNEWLRKHHFMPSVFLELTYRCNLKCVHCYNPKDISELEIPLEEAKKIIDDAYDLGCLTVTVSGGEATTHSRFIELARYVRSRHMALEVFTNGQRLANDEALYDELVSIYPHQIGLSLYSMTREKHDAVTAVPGSYDNTVNVIKRLREDGICVQIKNFLLNFTCSDCCDVCKFGKSIGASVGADISLIPTI